MLRTEYHSAPETPVAPAIRMAHGAQRVAAHDTHPTLIIRLGAHERVSLVHDASAMRRILRDIG